MGFDDLEAAERDRRDGEETTEQVTESASDSAEPTSESQETTTHAESTPSRASDGAADERDDQTATELTTERPSGAAVSETPAFEFGDVKQSPMYARPEAWNALEDALDLDVVRALREAGVRNEEKRELHDAALRVAADHPEEIADAVREARREDTN